MLRGRSTVVSVFLCFVCLLAQKPQPPARLCTNDILRRVRGLVSKAPALEWLGCRLYTPTIDDYEQKCPSSTLKCLADEIQVLTGEWGKLDKLKRLNLHNNLRTLAWLVNQTESGCRQCELFKEENAERFLNDLCKILHYMNSKNCYTTLTTTS
uniref:Interleukin n=1 Tax=Mastacembelus armatus TaxID=205130 RepID=A0A3Q3MXF4_9TELE